MPHPLGAENLHSLDEIADALVDMRAERPTMVSAIVKLNEGVSGEGNAVVDLAGLPAAGLAGRARRGQAAAARRWSSRRRTRPSRSTSPSSPRRRDRRGADRRRGAAQPERAAAGRFPAGEVELLSTHDQLLGGASGQSYLGCVLPGGRRVRAVDHRARRERSATARRARARSAVRGRLRRGAGRSGRGRRTRSSSTCARAARRIRSSPCSS